MSEIAVSETGLAAAPAAARREVSFRGGGFLAAPKPLYSWLSFAAILAIWQAAASAGLIDPVFLPSPASIVEALWQLTVSGELWRNLSVSLVRIGLGWVIGSALGIVTGLAMGLTSSGRAVGMPLVSAVYPVPKIALLPLFILWLGVGETPKVVLIASGVYFPTVISTLAGVDAVPRNLIRMGQSFNLPMRTIVMKVIMPSALPSILAGFRISVSVALILVVAAEMVGAQYGIGAFLLTAGNLMQSDNLMAGVVVLSVLGLVIGAILTALERLFLRWR